MKELLQPYGLLKAFNLVMDKHTGNSKVRPHAILSASPEHLVEQGPLASTVANLTIYYPNTNIPNSCAILLLL